VNKRWSVKPGPVTLVLPLVLLAGSPDSYSPTLLCTAALVVECDREGACDIGSAESVDLPHFLTVDLGARTIGTVDPARGERVSEIRSLEHGSGRLILSGIENGRTWGIIISEQTDEMSATVTDDGVGFAVFGKCMPYPD
jgi:hypothetical protein